MLIFPFFRAADQLEEHHRVACAAAAAVAGSRDSRLAPRAPGACRFQTSAVRCGAWLTPAAATQEEARARQRTLEDSALLPASREQIAQLTNLRAFLPVRAVGRVVGARRRGAPGCARPHPPAELTAGAVARSQLLGERSADSGSDAAADAALTVAPARPLLARTRRAL